MFEKPPATNASPTPEDVPEPVSMESVFQPKHKDFIETSTNALLSVDRPVIPENIEQVAADFLLEEKPEFHVSVIASKNGRIITQALEGREDGERIKQQIKELFLGTDWQYTYTDDYFLMEKHYGKDELAASGYKDVPEHTRRTLVQLVSMPELHAFYEKLSGLVGVSFDMPVPHITLFSGADYEPMHTRGIGIYSTADFDAYQVKKI